ncbi:HNH endonuclease [Gordonia Phage JonJames]|nr:HNH endonuclease [Gordonia Phage JonJames]
MATRVGVCAECANELPEEGRRPGRKRQYCADCKKERVRRQRSRRYQENREAEREYNRQWKANNPELVLEYARKWNRGNRDYHRRYYTENREDYYRRVDLRRARKLNNGTHPYTRQQIWDRHQGLCYLCHQPCDRRKGPGYNEWLGTVDHVHPLWLGGADAPWNVALSCMGCNLHKGKRVLAELDFTWFTQRTRPDTLKP